jgi:hypothetical protein
VPTHGEPDARALHGMPEAAGSRTSGEQLGPTRERLESQAWASAWPANALRLALRLQTHGEPDATALHGMPGAAESLRSASGVPQCTGARGVPDGGSTPPERNFCQ